MLLVEIAKKKGRKRRLLKLGQRDSIECVLQRICATDFPEYLENMSQSYMNYNF